MGRLLIVRVRRAGWATASIAVAFMVPVLAWQVTGSRAVEREASRELAAARERAQAAARNDAQRWAWRLERLRADETQRPWYVYQSFFHDPEVLSQGVAVQRSPLAKGPRDPLVAEYFRVTAEGRLELPGSAASPASPTGRDPARPARTLEPARLALTEELRRQPEPAAARTESIDVTGYTQNVQAAQLFSQLQTSPEAVAPPRRDPRRVQIRTGTLRWRTLPTAAGPALAAVREVRTPQGDHVQGFIVSAEEFARAFAGGPARATFAPATGAGQPVGDTGWEVRVDDRAAVAEATARGVELRARFARQFAWGALAALVAAACAMALVIQADRVARERSRFAAAAAHELRTPLAGLRLFGDLLAEHAGDPDRTRSYALRIAAESERLGRVVANVLGVTRLERGTLRVHPRVGDLTAATRAAVERQRPLLEAAGCRLSLETAGTVEASFDPDALEPILQNLLDNAERHTRDAESRDVVVRVEARGDRTAIVVEDSGPGVSPELRRQLFRGMTRRDANGSTDGLGLGLPLVAILARAQGGDVVCDEASGGGARFTVTFPRA